MNLGREEFLKHMDYRIHLDGVHHTLLSLHT